jgi:hypothetical protein
VRKGGGEAELKTVQGETLTVMRAGKGLTITDAKGGKSRVTIADVASRTASSTWSTRCSCPEPASRRQKSPDGDAGLLHAGQRVFRRVRRRFPAEPGATSGRTQAKQDES